VFSCRTPTPAYTKRQSLSAYQYQYQQVEARGKRRQYIYRAQNIEPEGADTWAMRRRQSTRHCAGELASAAPGRASLRVPLPAPGAPAPAPAVLPSTPGADTASSAPAGARRGRGRVWRRAPVEQQVKLNRLIACTSILFQMSSYSKHKDLRRFTFQVASQGACVQHNCSINQRA
jgi:hypothetical protein